MVFLNYITKDETPEMKNNNKTVKARGYIAKGSYGCVFKPAFKCEGASKRINGVTKLFRRKEHAYNEKELANIIDTIDPQHMWHLKTENVCVIDKKDTELKHLKDCKLDIPAPYYALNQEDGGVPVRRFIEKKNTSTTVSKTLITKTPSIMDTYKNPQAIYIILSSFSNIVNGITTMITNNIIHSDIKHDNIVYNQENSRFNLIDFGLITNLKHIVSSNLEQRSLKGYWVNPLDYAFIAPAFYSTFSSIKDKSDISKTKLDLTKIYIRGYMKTFESKYTEDGVYNYSLSTNVLERNINYLKDKTHHNIKLTIANTIDSYALGILCIQLCFAMTNKRFKLNPLICKKNHTLMKFKKSFDDYSTFYDYLYANFSVLIHKLCNPYIEYRATSKDCVDIWNDFLDTLYKHPDVEGLKKTPTIKPTVKPTIKVKIHIKKTLKKDKVLKHKTLKPCPDGKIRNPKTKTKRCINKNGKLAKKLKLG